MPSQVVLVHGGWHGGWVWERLAPLLAAQGHVVHTPTLTGMGERCAEFTPEVGLQTHVDDVLRTIDALGPGPLTLIGHSYGGSLITAVADAVPDRVTALVYLDAVIPTDGVPGWQGFPPERQAQMLAGAERLGGLRVPPPDPSIWGFEPGSPDHAHLQQRLTPHPLKTMMDVPRITGRWKLVASKCYLLAAGPPASRFAHHHAACQAEPGWTTAVVPGGHEMMWTHPEDLAQALPTCIARDAGAAPTPTSTPTPTP
jgi:pimeloyl-ACP methyl ester carboxylesterase